MPILSECMPLRTKVILLVCHCAPKEFYYVIAQKILTRVFLDIRPGNLVFYEKKT